MGACYSALREAEIVARDLKEIQQDFATALAAMDWARAASLAEEYRGASPERPLGWLLGSIAALAASRLEDALILVEGGLKLAPDDFQCRLQRAEVLLARGDRIGALAAADAAADCAGHIPAALDAVGVFLVHARDNARALAVYDKAVLAAPDDVQLLGRRASVNRWLGRFDAAEQDLQRALQLRPNDARTLKAIGTLRVARADPASIPALHRALAAARGDTDQTIALHFALAKAHEDAGDTGSAWPHLEIANNLQRAQLNYSPAQDRENFQIIMRGFADVERPQPDTTGAAPIFVVGLPRTGTTLIERVLGSHSQVYAAGELSALSEAIAEMPNMSRPVGDTDWGRYASMLHSVEGPALAAAYLRRTAQLQGTKARFTDKALINFFYCPLILRAFPNAHIVHVTRHPLAATFAIYKTRFHQAFPFTYDLTELADFIIGYRQLMAHWHSILPNRILDVAYEDMVTAQEATTRRLLEYCNLPFEAGCLEFHKTDGSVMTASAVQVRMPLYRSSLENWRAYEKALAPARQRLVAAGIDVD
jgi:Flp pilus assembly protein TadD, contains TPR repeats